MHLYFRVSYTHMCVYASAHMSTGRALIAVAHICCNSGVCFMKYICVCICYIHIHVCRYVFFPPFFVSILYEICLCMYMLYTYICM